MKHPVDYILMQAEANPNSVAVIDSGIETSYANFMSLSLSFSKIISSLNRENPKVYIYLPHGLFAYSAIVGSLYAGGTHTPANFDSPIGKIDAILNQLNPDIIITNANGLAKLPRFGNRNIYLVENIINIAPYEGPPKYADISYIIFTSGSTGVPKGVEIYSSSLYNYVKWLISLDIMQSDRISQQPNLGFDISMTDIFGALCNGASLIPIVSKSDSLSLGDFIKREKITRWNSTPSAIGMMISSGQLNYENISTIKVFVFCGEPLMYEYVEAIFKILPDALIYNTYGPTEATVAVTSVLLTNRNYNNYSMDGAIAIGSPIHGNDIIIDVKSNEEQASEGELYISGLQLARGYFNDQDKTEGVFLRKHFHDRGEIFCYKTGDYVKKVAGNIYFKERVDFQVKIKGHRIELDEVSSAIRKLGWPLVLSFVIDDRIISIVEKVIGKNFNEAIIRKSLREHLETYATPSRVYCVDRIPRNDNDKLDRMAAINLVSST